jgi:hypothetical protein
MRLNNGTPTLASQLGLLPAELTTISDDNDTMTFCAQSTTNMDTFMDAFRQYRKAVTESIIGEPTPVVPAYIPLATGPTTPAGIFQRLDNFVKRIRAASSYTDEIGALLGIIPSKGEDIVETEMKPVLKANAMPGSVVQVSFTRGKSDGVVIETKVDNSSTWSSAGTYFKSPASVIIPDGTGMPHAVQIRARYVIGNEAAGLNSDTVNVVTTP